MVLSVAMYQPRNRRPAADCSIYSKKLIDPGTNDMSPELVKRLFAKCVRNERKMELVCAEAQQFSPPSHHPHPPTSFVHGRYPCFPPVYGVASASSLPSYVTASAATAASYCRDEEANGALLQPERMEEEDGGGPVELSEVSDSEEEEQQKEKETRERAAKRKLLGDASSSASRKVCVYSVEDNVCSVAGDTNGHLSEEQQRIDKLDHGSSISSSSSSSASTSTSADGLGSDPESCAATSEEEGSGSISSKLGLLRQLFQTGEDGGRKEQAATDGVGKAQAVEKGAGERCEDVSNCSSSSWMAEVGCSRMEGGQKVDEPVTVEVVKNIVEEQEVIEEAVNADAACSSSRPSAEQQRCVAETVKNSVESSTRTSTARSGAASEDPMVVDSGGRRLVRNGKLALILDLDNTLLHALAQAKMGIEINERDYVDKRGEPELYKFCLPSNKQSTYYLKLRPGLRDMLDHLAPFFEMSIYTNATKEYTDVVLKSIDPDRKIFGDRVVARDFESQREQKKELEKLYPSLDPHCLIIFDDRTDVWSDGLQPHILRAEMYDFLESYKEELAAYYSPQSANFNLFGGAVCVASASSTSSNAFDNIGSRINSSKPPTPYHRLGDRVVDFDRHLHYMTKTLIEIHRQYFCNECRISVGQLLPKLRSRVLEGVGICLTGNFKNYNNNPVPADHTQVDNGKLNTEKALELGATVHTDPSAPEVTHIVAGNSKTDLFVRSKLYSHLKRVHTLWLWNACATWEKPPEDVFDAEALCPYYKFATKWTPIRDNWAIRTGAELEAILGLALRSTLLPTVSRSAPAALTDLAVVTASSSATAASLAATAASLAGSAGVNTSFATTVEDTKQETTVYSNITCSATTCSDDAPS